MKHSQIAIHAARNRNKWGSYLTLRYLTMRNCPLSLYRLACQLEAAQKVVDLMPSFLKQQAH